MRQPQPTPGIHHLASTQQQQTCCARRGDVTLPLPIGRCLWVQPSSSGHATGWGQGPHTVLSWLCPTRGSSGCAATCRVPSHPVPRAHVPCKEHAGVHDGSPQDSNGCVLCLQLILPGAGEADGEVLPLVEHCREVEVREGGRVPRAGCPQKVGPLTSLRRAAGQRREGKVHHVAADDGGLQQP